MPPAGGPAALYAAFAPAAGGDELVAVAVDAAGRAELHKMEEAGGRMTMAEVAAAPVKAGEALRLGPGGLHGMLFELARPLAAGDTARATFTFKAAGPVTAPALVVPYAEIERRLEEARP